MPDTLAIGDSDVVSEAVFHAAMLTDFRRQGCRGKATGLSRGLSLGLSPGLTFGLSIGLSNSAEQGGGTGHGR